MLVWPYVVRIRSDILLDELKSQVLSILSIRDLYMHPIFINSNRRRLFLAQNIQMIYPRSRSQRFRQRLHPAKSLLWSIYHFPISPTLIICECLFFEILYLIGVSMLQTSQRGVPVIPLSLKKHLKVTRTLKVYLDKSRCGASRDGTSMFSCRPWRLMILRIQLQFPPDAICSCDTGRMIPWSRVYIWDLNGRAALGTHEWQLYFLQLTDVKSRMVILV